VVAAYVRGYGLRQVGELVDHSQTAVRRVLAKHQVPLRSAGAPASGATHRTTAPPAA